MQYYFVTLGTNRPFIIFLLAAYYPGQLHPLSDRSVQGIVGSDAELLPHHAVAWRAGQAGENIYSR